MTPASIFGLATRILGLAVLYRAISLLPSTMVNLSNVLFLQSPTYLLTDPLIVLSVHLASAAWLVFGAPPLPRWAYPDPH